MTDDEQPKPPAPRRSLDQDIAEGEVRRAVRDVSAYFRGQRSHREALSALKRIKRFVRAQQKQHPATVAIRSAAPAKTKKTGT
jgi:hypothetical protein